MATTLVLQDENGNDLLTELGEAVVLEVARPVPFAEWLFQRLPEATRWRDEVEGGDAIRQLCAVLGQGLDSIADDIDALPGIVDVDLCPPELLPALSKLLGIEFPYALSVEVQRSYIRNAVALYRVKGSTTAMTQALARLIGGGYTVNLIGENFVAKTFTVVLEGADDSLQEAELEDKVLYLVGVNTPAGLIPTVLFAYFTVETLAKQQSYLDTHVEYTRYSCNLLGHNINSFPVAGQAFRTNAFGNITLDL